MASSTKKTKRTTKPEEEYSQLPYPADAAEELSQSPASPEFLPASSESPDSSTKSSQTEAVLEKENKACYLTREKLLTVKCDKLRRQLAPIKKWGSLSVGHPYLLKRIISMEVQKKADKLALNKASSSTSKTGYIKETAYYAELETETDSIMNVWITSIMLAEAENYDLASGDVYIIPLGKRVSQENGNEYHAFVIVRADELEFNN